MESPATEAFSDDSGVELKPQHAPGAESRRNKRKSSEPKKRKDGLLMKRFRWDSDEEEEERERPSSGDSGCQVDVATPPKKRRSPKAASAVLRQSVIRKHEAAPLPVPSPGPSDERGGSGVQRGRPRNYKSMSRQRRIEANARERTRVHTISAAFESLRRAVPAYAHNQKLSKLAILRIASAYIVALACLNQQDHGQQVQARSSLAECVEQCTRTIQAEGRSRRRSAKE